MYSFGGEESILLGGDYIVQWDSLGAVDDFDMEYSVHSIESDLYIDFRVKYDDSEINPDVDYFKAETNREMFENIETNEFKQIWNDIRSANNAQEVKDTIRNLK